MKRKSNIFIICTISIAAALVLVGGIYMKFFGSRSKDVTIIGGSDGPTTIFLAGKGDPSNLLWLLFFIFILGISVFLFIKHRKNKKN